MTAISQLLTRAKEIEKRNDDREYQADIDERAEENQKELREQFEDELVEHWYSRYVAEESDDWRDEFLARAYADR